MAFSVKVGVGASRTTTGNQGYTGVGFQPKVVIFFWSGLSEGGNCIGAAVSSSERGEAHTTLDDNVTTSNALRGWSTARCLYTIATNATARWVADFVSMDSDGFTLNWTTVQTGAVNFGYVALGGSDLTNVKVATFSVTSGTGNQSFTATGFQPDALLFFGTHTGTSAVNGDAHGSLLFGHAFSTSDRGVSAYHSQDNAAAGDEQGASSASACIIGVVNDLTLDSVADFVSFNSDGFTINRTVSGTSRTYFYIALKGTNLRFQGGVLDQPTSNGVQTITQTTFTPEVVFFHSAGKSALATASADTRHWFGACRSNTSNERLGLAIGANNGADPTHTIANLRQDDAVRIEDGDGTAIVVGDTFARTNNGFTINWTTTDATARKVHWIALGEAPKSMPPPKKIARAHLAM